MNHPITPSPGLVQEWSYDCPLTDPFNRERYIATQAARWGADQELEACCDYMQQEDFHGFAKEVRAARRPKPPSLAEQALAVVENSAICDHLSSTHETVLRAALERLQELEQSHD